MPRNIQKITVDIKNQNNAFDGVVYSGDAVTFSVEIEDSGAKADLSDIDTFLLIHKRPHMKAISTPGKLVSGNLVEFELGTSEIAIPGTVEAVVQLYDEVGRVTPMAFSYTVKADPTAKGLEISTTDKSFIEIVLGEGPDVIQGAKEATAAATGATEEANRVKVETEEVKNQTAAVLETAEIAVTDTKAATKAANDAAATAEEKAGYAEEQGDKAKAEAEAAAAQKLEVAEVLGAGPVYSVNGKTGAVEGLATAAQLAETINKTDEIAKNPYSHKGAIFTIVDDDAKTEFRTIWNPILEDTGAKITIAAITDWVGTSGYMSLQELKDLQTKGHEIVSHTVTHRGTADVAVANAELEYPQSQQWLKDNGFNGHETLVYPGGMPVNRIDLKNVARKYYKYAIATNIGGEYNMSPIDNWRVPRIQGDTYSLAQLKSAVDQAIIAGGWVILMTHSHVVDPQKMRDIIAYVQSKNVPIMPFGEAAKYKGNAVAIGEFETGGTFIGMDGSGKLGGGLVVRTDSKLPMNEPVTSYQRNSQTIVTLSSATDSFLGVGGVMEVFRAYHDSYSYATFKPANSYKLYQRRCNYTTGVWGNWEDFNKTTFSAGTWTPVLKGVTTAGNHSYTRQEGRFTKYANLITVSFAIRIEAASLDSTMAGALQIIGLPTPSSNTFALPVSPVQYNHLTLPTNYTNLLAKPRAAQNFIDLFISGNGVAENYLTATQLTTGQAVILNGQLTYAIE